MADSTKLVDSQTPQFAAEIYKTYLVSAAKIVKSLGGSITAYDGDRIMSVFIGDHKNSNAAKAGLKINAAVIDIINPVILKQYPATSYRLKHVVGVDISSLFAARIGVRNDNDLVWVGRAANHAAKLTSINEHNSIFITGAVFDKLHIARDEHFSAGRKTNRSPSVCARPNQRISTVRESRCRIRRRSTVIVGKLM